ncbi:proline--tRNA ligase [Candidatus Woesearchaeota archaeon]|nr:proline--tRNA ligase [Candidatus Woesearchaeota archaeon]
MTAKDRRDPTVHSNDVKGLTVKKSEDFSEWYTQLIQKAELADYSAVSGCIIYRPNSYAVWEKIRDEVDRRFKAIGIKNAYFPLFIPEKLLQKEASHIEGFSPEVAWVTQAGDSKLDERIAVRPTSETIMYDSYSKWIRSHRDLPLRLNQWNNVVRWEFKHPVPFLRGREFLWNEGHTVFATKKEAEAEKDQIIGIYKEVCENYLALPSLIGKKSEKEKFAGAEYTVSMEFLMPNGKAIQGPDFHHDGQIFAKAFEITFLDDKGEKKYAWQNTWAITTRMLGVLFAVHSDDRGLILPPKVALTQVVVVPILFDATRDVVLREAANISKKLKQKGIAVHLDDRDDYTPGWKYNEWEMKGIPLRLELGPKDLEKKQVMVVRRDTGEKKAVLLEKLDVEIPALLETIQHSLFDKAEKHLTESIVTVQTFKDAEKQLKAEKLLFAPWCGLPTCEEKFKEKTGAKSLNSPLEQPGLKKDQRCFACSEKATVWFYFGKSY